MGGGDSFSERGRLRSAWTHRVGLPNAVHGDGGGMDGPYTEGTDQQVPGPGVYQPLQPLHTHSNRAGAASGPGTEPDSGTPKKLNPALTYLQQQQQQLYSSRSRPLFTSVDREILCNALACAGASMADPLMSMVDSYYAGKLGTTALAALGSNGALFSVLYFLCFTALAVLCTQAMASANSRGDAEGCGRGFIQAVTATLLVSCVLVCVLLSAPEQLLGMFQNDSEVLQLAKTYCMIRALSLPAALSINVSQAAFRSMLDLTTPFCIVMAVNAANYLLNELLMVVLPYGMAGCGWASVISQYMGALLFAAVIYRRRHKFGIPEALACAEDRYYEQRQLMRSPAPGSSSGASSTMVARKLANSRSGSGSRNAGALSGGGSSSGSKHSPHKRGQPGRVKRHSKGSSREHSPRRGISPRRSRESSGTLRIDVTAFEQHIAKTNGAFGADHGGSPGSRRSSSRHSPAGDASAAVGGYGGQAEVVLGSTASGTIHHRHHAQQQYQLQGGQGADAVDGGFPQQHLVGQGLLSHHQQDHPGQQQHALRLVAAAAEAAAARYADSSNPGSIMEAPEQQLQQQQHASGRTTSAGGHYKLHRWDSAGSESKLPRYLVGSGSSSRLWLLMMSLDWAGFVKKFAGMTTRGMLILSTYTSANLVAASGGTAVMAAHQVVQQQQQLQMSFAWSFLHVGQSMTANLFHSTSALSGRKAARRLSERIVAWASCSCTLLAFGTFAYRHTLPTIFSSDEAVQQLVLSAALPAAVMLGLGWNNSLEGCLLAADDQPFVVRMYPCAVAAALLQLAWGYWADTGLPGVWMALMTYYLVLLIGFAGRYWVFRGKL